MNSKKIGYLAGVFDFCHEGHISIINRALKLCDRLIVAVVSDSFALKYKKQKIEYNEDERVAMIESLNLVDDVLIVDNNDHKAFFEIVRQDPKTSDENHLILETYQVIEVTDF